MTSSANQTIRQDAGGPNRLRLLFNAIDKIWLMSLLLIVGIAIASIEQAQESLIFTFDTFLLLAPYLIFAFGLAAYLKAASVELLVAQVFQGRTVAMIVAASFFGALSPLCSCAVIPLVAVLLRSGMPLSAVMAFWISSPIMSPDMYIYTGALLGFEFATVKVLAAIFMGLFAGFILHGIVSMGALKQPLRNSVLTRRTSQGPTLSPMWKFWQEPERVELFKKEFISVGKLLTKILFLAFLLESLMLAYVPADVIAQWLGQSSDWAIPLAVLTGIPAYLNGVAAVPLMQGLISMGMTKSAALAFLAAGSVTSIPAVMAVYPIVRTSVFLWYIAIALISSLIVGYSYQLFLQFV